VHLYHGSCADSQVKQMHILQVVVPLMVLPLLVVSVRPRGAPSGPDNGGGLGNKGSGDGSGTAATVKGTCPFPADTFFIHPQKIHLGFLPPKSTCQQSITLFLNRNRDNTEVTEGACTAGIIFNFFTENQLVFFGRQYPCFFECFFLKVWIDKGRKS